ncbi:MAG TPA: hypothetical protein VFA10_12135 [Ktedonobacteraceae bacterium]|jgi:hypothetical protein|nr:hypothetical protein [Ktedonobacteraceae bacterium]
MNELPPFVLEFDSEGNLVQPQQQTDILQAVAAENPSVTDLWVLSYWLCSCPDRAPGGQPARCYLLAV